MRKLRTRFLVGGAVAVLAAATAFAATNSAVATTAVNTDALTTSGTPTATTGTTLSITTLSITVGESAIKAGQQDSISGTLLSDGRPAAAQEVRLYRFSHRLNKWRPIRTKPTSQAGVVTFEVHPGITRKYELVYHGDSSLAPTTSSVVTVTVAPAAKRVTALSVSAAPASIAAGHSAKITGVLTADGKPLARRVVSLYRYDISTSKWVRIAVELTGPHGGVAFTRKPTATSTFALAYGGAPTLTNVHSGKVTVTVTG